ncbi:MAG TPA: tetratricopeptide repeat protein, partial [Chloroflexota bacterium]|nr:tetratricopeptide repeat protein [Chloroflexota bacterium]
RLQPDFPEAHNNLGLSLHALGRDGEAMASYQAALRLRPDFAEAHDNAGVSLQALQRFEEAVSQHLLALTIKPELVSAHTNLGNALRHLGRIEEAVARQRVALQLAPNSAEVHNNMGAALEASGDVEAAAEHYRKAVELRPDDPHAHFHFAEFLRGCGRRSEAIVHYKAAVSLKPDFAEAHNNAGALLLDLHHYQAAAVHFASAIASQPGNVAAHNNAGLALQALNRMDEARMFHEEALRLEPGNQKAHRCLALLYVQVGDLERARHEGRLGYGDGLERQPYRGAGTPVRILVLQSVRGGNLRLIEDIDDETFDRWDVTTEFWDGSPLPEHDVVLNAIGEADLCGEGLRCAQELVAHTDAPVLNTPDKVMATGRLANAERLRRIEGVMTPHTAVLSREVLAGEGAVEELTQRGFSWPLLLRSPGFHTGEHFVKVDRPGDLALAVASMPGQQLFVLQFIDVADAAGAIRKYRVMFVDGELFPLHLAISSNWMVHFGTADMADSAEHRAEDAAFLNDMPAVLGQPVMRALQALRDELGLDYGGVDFSLDRWGRLVVWEANATMVAPLPDKDERWDYRRPGVEAVRAATRRMLLTRGVRNEPAPPH